MKQTPEEIRDEIRRGRLNQPRISRLEALAQIRRSIPLSPSAEAEYQRSKYDSDNGPKKTES